MLTDRSTPVPPPQPRGRVVAYRDTVYPVLLLGWLSLLMIVNGLELARGRLIAGLPLLLQALIVAVVVARHPIQIFAVRIWSVLLAGTGAFGISAFVSGALAHLTAPGRTPVPVLFPRQALGQALLIAGGIYFFSQAARAPVFEGESSPPATT